MPDPRSIIATVVGIIVLALHDIRLLLKDLQELKDAPKLPSAYAKTYSLSIHRLNCYKV
jgi:hypothetical protein